MKYLILVFAIIIVNFKSIAQTPECIKCVTAEMPADRKVAKYLYDSIEIKSATDQISQYFRVNNIKINNPENIYTTIIIADSLGYVNVKTSINNVSTSECDLISKNVLKMKHNSICYIENNVKKEQDYFRLVFHINSLYEVTFSSYAK